MTWDEAIVPALRGGEVVRSRVRFAAGDVCVVEVEAGGTDSRGEAGDLFEALARARRDLEARDVLLGCNGARRDVFPSAMQRQTGWARRAYVLAIPRTTGRPPVVDIFAAAPESSVLATVDEQRAWFDRWRQIPPEERGSP
jgi:hypothetical protein